MAPLRYSVLALLALAINGSLALPAGDAATRRPRPPKHTRSKRPAFPTPSNQISLSPPDYSVTWDLPDSDPTDEPDLPPIFPTPSNQISLGPPSYSVSWDNGGPEPTPTDDPEEPLPPLQTPSNRISLNPPSYGISWDAVPEPTDEPEPTDGPTEILPTPQPTNPNEVTLLPPSASVSWGKREANPAQTDSYGLQFPTFSFFWPKPKPTSVYVSWGKRQDDAEPTEVPEPQDPEDPEPGPIEIPPIVVPSQPNSVGIEPPTATVIWGKDKRQIEYGPEPTDIADPWEPEPEDPEEPGPIDIPPINAPAPGNSIGIQPPKATVIWGKDKRQDDEEPGEPEDPEPGPIDIPPNNPNPGNSVGIQPPTATVIWGKDKREPEAEAQGNSWGLIWPTNIPFPPGIFPKPPPRPTQSNGYISWGKREYPTKTKTPPKSTKKPKPPKSTKKPSPPKTSTAPCDGCWISWGKRDADERKHTRFPTALRPTPIPMPSKAAPSELPPYNPLCPTATFTMVPPCIPPTCPHKQTPCDFHKPMPTWEVRKREPEPVAVVEEVVTIKTVSFTGTPTAIRDPGCTVTPTITEFATCPTYTCVPYCDAAQVVR